MVGRHMLSGEEWLPCRGCRTSVIANGRDRNGFTLRLGAWHGNPPNAPPTFRLVDASGRCGALLPSPVPAWHRAFFTSRVPSRAVRTGGGLSPGQAALIPLCAALCAPLQRIVAKRPGAVVVPGAACPAGSGQSVPSNHDCCSARWTSGEVAGLSSR